MIPLSHLQLFKWAKVQAYYFQVSTSSGLGYYSQSRKRRSCVMYRQREVDTDLEVDMEEMDQKGGEGRTHQVVWKG